MIKKTKKTAAYRRVASRLKRLLGEGQVIEGSLSRVTAGSAAHWHLTRKVNGRPLPALRGLPQALAGDVGEDALRGDPRPRPRVGAARRGRRDADAAVPPRRLKSDGERRPDLHAATILPLSRDGGKGVACLQIPNSAPLREIKNRPGRRAKRILSIDLESFPALGAY